MKVILFIVDEWKITFSFILFLRNKLIKLSAPLKKLHSYQNMQQNPLVRNVCKHFIFEL